MKTESFDGYTELARPLPERESRVFELAGKGYGLCCRSLNRTKGRVMQCFSVCIRAWMKPISLAKTMLPKNTKLPLQMAH